MYLCHFMIFKRDLVTNVGGLRTEMDGGQDFDLALRLLPNLKNVIHIPQPLYHWRAWSESTKSRPPECAPRFVRPLNVTVSVSPTP